MNDLDDFLFDENDSIQKGGHSTQWYLRQAALRNASMLTNEKQAEYVTIAATKGSTEPIEDVVERSEAYLLDQRRNEEFKRIRERQEKYNG